jgi:hypothetical protein
MTGDVEQGGRQYTTLITSYLWQRLILSKVFYGKLAEETKKKENEEAAT